MNNLEITEINIVPFIDKTKESNIQAFVRIVLNEALVINSIKIIRGKFGLFISFPREYNKQEGKWYNIVFPITKVLMDYMSEKILNEYNKTVNNSI